MNEKIGPAEFINVPPHFDRIEDLTRIAIDLWRPLDERGIRPLFFLLPPKDFDRYFDAVGRFSPSTEGLMLLGMRIISCPAITEPAVAGDPLQQKLRERIDKK